MLTIVDMCFEKLPGNPLSHKLRIIQKMEADLNFMLGLLWSTRLNKVISQYKLRNEAQSAYSKGLDTVRIGLSKTIIADYARHNYLIIAINDLEASAAFDTISTNGQRLMSQRNGMHGNATKLL